LQLDYLTFCIRRKMAGRAIGSPHNPGKVHAAIADTEGGKDSAARLKDGGWWIGSAGPDMLIEEK
jgi:hypothetical protein